ncbi:hypothetical protein K0028_11025 [Curtobacterium flaccumfaciens pv. flaccumfaciens]|uniref:hypothetical protein n=1 Tax=Curtobacterium flaccumfaciens TaxID=2035 RepID=UPI0021B09BAD|nr:hypothetical protein [Curtobacterium flaccumfaciens]QYI96239.1 hypothetical protein K0028_11025 [Curtobacterium flaccumfaciens pv. flaccumfaciens]
MTDTAATRSTLPWAVDWFLNRTNAGDVQSVLETFAPGASVTHDGVVLRNEIIGEFVQSPWFIAGYIHVPIRHWLHEDDRWQVIVDMSGRHEDLRAEAGPFLFDFRLGPSGRIADLIITARSDSVAQTT